MSQVKEDRALLAGLFPQCFAAPGGAKRPLMRGIREELVRRGVLPAERISAVLRDYCAGRGYLEAVAAGGARVDPDGRPTGAVDGVARAVAKRALAKQAENNAGQLFVAALVDLLGEEAFGRVDVRRAARELPAKAIRLAWCAQSLATYGGDPEFRSLVDEILALFEAPDPVDLAAARISPLPPVMVLESADHWKGPFRNSTGTGR